MNKVNLKKLNRSINMYPIFYGLTADLIFWIAINTLFLTTIKHLTASQLNSLEAIGIVIGILFQLILIKIVRKIGNLNAIRLGTIFLFFSVLFNTISTRYIGFLIAEIFSIIGFSFKYMDSVVLLKNLNYLNRKEEYVNYQTKGNAIYSFITLIISIISGFLFNINPYVPMVICLLICFNNIILSFFVYEVPYNEEVKKEKNTKKFLNKKLILMLLLYGAFYALIACGQKNSKLFIQFTMQDIFNLSKVAIYMSIFISISRVVRLLSNLIFLKLYDKYKNIWLTVFECCMIFSFVFLLVGNYINNLIGIWIMSIGFYLYLFLRDPFDTYLKKVLFDNSDEKVHDKIINYMSLIRKIFSLLYSTMITFILLKFDYHYVMTVLLLISIMFIPLIISIDKMMKKNIN